jgi:hypothetical protein
MGSVGHIESRDVDSTEDEFFEILFALSGGTEGGDDLGAANIG